MSRGYRGTNIEKLFCSLWNKYYRKLLLVFYLHTYFNERMIIIEHLRSLTTPSPVDNSKPPFLTAFEVFL